MFIESKQKVSLGYSPGDDSAGLLTPVEMTFIKSLEAGKLKLYHYPSLCVGEQDIKISAGILIYIMAADS
jgi:hypothetical protein